MTNLKSSPSQTPKFRSLCCSLIPYGVFALITFSGQNSGYVMTLIFFAKLVPGLLKEYRHECISVV